jgi:hypothetical protein
MSPELALRYACRKAAIPSLTGVKWKSKPAPEMTRLTHDVTLPLKIDALRKVHCL